MESELLVVVGPDPLRGVDRATLQSRIDVGAAEDVDRDAQACHDLSRESWDAHAHAPQVGERLDGSPEPPPELDSRVPTRNRGHSEVRVDTAEHIQAAPVVKPRRLLTRVQPEGDGGSERERRMFADVVVVARVTGVDRAGLHAVHYLEGRNEFAGRKYADRKASAREGLDPVRDEQSGPVENVQTRRKTRRHAPTDSRARDDAISTRTLCFGTCAPGQHARASSAETGFLDEISTIQMVHGVLASALRIR